MSVSFLCCPLVDCYFMSQVCRLHFRLGPVSVVTHMLGLQMEVSSYRYIWCDISFLVNNGCYCTLSQKILSKCDETEGVPGGEPLTFIMTYRLKPQCRMRTHTK